MHLQASHKNPVSQKFSDDPTVTSSGPNYITQSSVHACKINTPMQMLVYFKYTSLKSHC